MVRLALGFLGLSWESRLVDPDDRSELERISGQAQVPVLVDGDRVIPGSSEILQYLVANHDGKLVPRGRRDQTLTVLLTAHVDTVLAPLCKALIHGTGADKQVLREQLTNELQALEGLLDRGEFLFGPEPSIADIRAGAWLIRLDSALALTIPEDLQQVRAWIGRLRNSSATGTLASGEAAT
jgi:glutathione S-transferase